MLPLSPICTRKRILLLIFIQYNPTVVNFKVDEGCKAQQKNEQCFWCWSRAGWALTLGLGPTHRKPYHPPFPNMWSTLNKRDRRQRDHRKTRKLQIVQCKHDKRNSFSFALEWISSFWIESGINKGFSHPPKARVSKIIQLLYLRTLSLLDSRQDSGNVWLSR